MSLERCCITVACRRKRLASKCLLHHWCNTLGFQGLRDVTGEMLHHGGMLKEGLVSICCIRVNVATNHASGIGHSFEAGELSWLHHKSQLQQCYSKLHTREGEEKGTTTQGNVASGQQHCLINDYSTWFKYLHVNYQCALTSHICSTCLPTRQCVAQSVGCPYKVVGKGS